LLTNAVKYTPTGGLINVAIEVGAQFLTIAKGLAPEAMSKVFDMFTQVESELGRSEGGLGIGLALAKALVQLHGGRLEVNSAGPGPGE
jgi:signal transduction histidine kinase